ncbi:MAG TPA: DALR anticodon-binding domain-containing protein [Gemmatimonadota bacterium]|nr:DALR anticodon-binding domain-containing protein [Gemmatimonadota bacterium]
MDDEPLARARLALARACANAPREGLALLGVAAPETM